LQAEIRARSELVLPVNHARSRLQRKSRRKRFMKKFVPVAGVPPWRSTVEPNRELEPAFINLRGTNLGTAGSLSAATFPRIIWISCTRNPSVIHDRSPFY
jgi:hypothetical protein